MRLTVCNGWIDNSRTIGLKNDITMQFMEEFFISYKIEQSAAFILDGIVS